MRKKMRTNRQRQQRRNRRLKDKRTIKSKRVVNDYVWYFNLVNQLS